MRLNVINHSGKRVGFFPFLLVFLLAVRVAASPAIQCHHELAAQATRIAQATAGIPLQAGDLCGLLIADSDSEHDEDVLNSLCPFFLAPGILPVNGADVAANEQSFSWFLSIPRAIRSDVDAGWTGYNSRAPPAVV